MNTKNSWLHGDERGFRSRDHRIDSTGDYRNPPPTEEHEGLRDYHLGRAGELVTISKQLRPLAARAFRDRLKKEGYRVLVVSCSTHHVHALVELPDDRRVITDVIGRCKRAACEAIKDVLPGSIWAAKGEFKPVKDVTHQRNTFKYIRDEQEVVTFVWTFRDEELWI